MATERYKKMLTGMKAKEKLQGSTADREKWSVYILRCGDDSLYTGIAKDVSRRFHQHSKGKGAKYTRTRLPLEIVYEEICLTRAQALMREYKVKCLQRIKKLALIKKHQTKKKSRRGQSHFASSIKSPSKSAT